MAVSIVNSETHCSQPRRPSVSLTKVQSCNVPLCMLLLRDRSYLKSFLRYKSLILDVYHPDILYLREQRFQDPCVFFYSKKWSTIKRVCETLPCRGTAVYRMGSKTLTDSHITLWCVYKRSRPQWPYGLRRRSAAPWLLQTRLRIPLR